MGEEQEERARESCRGNNKRGIAGNRKGNEEGKRMIWYCNYIVGEVIRKTGLVINNAREDIADKQV